VLTFKLLQLSEDHEYLLTVLQVLLVNLRSFSFLKLAAFSVLIFIHGLRIVLYGISENRVQDLGNGDLVNTEVVHPQPHEAETLEELR